MTANGAVKITGIIDSDGHIFERDSEIQPYLGEGYQHDHLLNFPFFPTLDGWNRGALGAPSAERLAIGHPDAAAWVSFLDAYGLAATVLYPTAGLGAGFIKSPAWFIDLARGYNNYVHDRFLKASPRLKAVAMLPVLDPKAAAAELRRAVKELGMVGGLLPSIGLRLPYGDAAFDPLYAEAQALGTMLAVHGAPQQGMGFDFFESFGPGMVLEHPISQMIQFTSMITDKVFVRFPNLKVAFLEAGCGWAPYLIERIDQRAGGVASAQVRNSPIYFHAELKEQDVLTCALSVIGEDRFLYASDYPHEPPSEVKEALEGFLARDDVSPRAKEKILRDNIKAIYSM